MSGFDVRAVCPSCLSRFRAPFGSLFHIHFEVCPNCGTPKSDFDLRTERWVSKAKWWNPLTWNDGRWERPKR